MHHRDPAPKPQARHIEIQTMHGLLARALRLPLQVGLQEATCLIIFFHTMQAANHSAQAKDHENLVASVPAAYACQARAQRLTA